MCRFENFFLKKVAGVAFVVSGMRYKFTIAIKGNHKGLPLQTIGWVGAIRCPAKIAYSEYGLQNGGNMLPPTTDN